ncbi:FAD-binding oxidoreductase, partial [Mesorhizobium sp. M2A.F.Ca.ET.040.01.1.1]
MTELINALRSILGPRGLLTEPADVAPFLTDFRGRMTGHARAVALPATVEEAASTMRLAFEHDTPVYPLGGNTGLCFGAVPVGNAGRPDGLVVCLSRMNGLRSLDLAANVLTV